MFTINKMTGRLVSLLMAMSLLLGLTVTGCSDKDRDFNGGGQVAYELFLFPADTYKVEDGQLLKLEGLNAAKATLESETESAETETESVETETESAETETESAETETESAETETEEPVNPELVWVVVSDPSAEDITVEIGSEAQEFIAVGAASVNDSSVAEKTLYMVVEDAVLSVDDEDNFIVDGMMVSAVEGAEAGTKATLTATYTHRNTELTAECTVYVASEEESEETETESAETETESAETETESAETETESAETETESAETETESVETETESVETETESVETETETESIEPQPSPSPSTIPES